MSLPPDAAVNSRALARRKSNPTDGREGRESVRGALAELRELGYAACVRVRRDDGTFATHWLLTDDPASLPCRDGDECDYPAGGDEPPIVRPRPEKPSPARPVPARLASAGWAISKDASAKDTPAKERSDERQAAIEEEERRAKRVLLRSAIRNATDCEGNRIEPADLDDIMGTLDENVKEDWQDRVVAKLVEVFESNGKPIRSPGAWWRKAIINHVKYHRGSDEAEEAVQRHRAARRRNT